jgi:signal transduction histidine kinase
VTTKSIWLEIFRKDIILAFLFGILSYLLGLVKFNIPGLSGAVSDLREIPLLISIFYLTNPWYLIITCFISAFGTPPEGSIISTYLMHVISLIITWFIYNRFRNQKRGSIISGVLWFFYTFVYYLAFVLPLMILTNYMFGLNTDKKFFSFYLEMISSSRFEIVTTAFVTSLYLVQHKIRLALEESKANLEVAVKERTEELTETIGELKSAQQHLIQSEKMAALGTLTSGVAHEINNPLNFISGGLYFLDELKGELDSIKPEELRKRLDLASGMAQSGLNRAAEIVKAMMTFSTPVVPQLIEVDIHQIIDNTLLFQKPMIGDITISKEYLLTEKVPVYPEKIQHTILNIIDNAIFAINLSKTERREIIISTKRLNDSALLQISNTGPLIPEDQIDKVFDPFFTTKAPNVGSGIGLSICYALVTEHNGSVKVENEGDIVSFYIELPLYPLMREVRNQFS